MERLAVYKTSRCETAHSTDSYANDHYIELAFTVVENDWHVLVGLRVGVLGGVSGYIFFAVRWFPTMSSVYLHGCLLCGVMHCVMYRIELLQTSKWYPDRWISGIVMGAGLLEVL